MVSLNTPLCDFGWKAIDFNLEGVDENPDIGVNLGSNIRKIRLSVKSKNKGKSGGARIITFNIIANIIARKILLVTLYDKSEQQTISDAEIKRIIKNCNL